MVGESEEVYEDFTNELEDLLNKYNLNLIPNRESGIDIEETKEKVTCSARKYVYNRVCGNAYFTELRVMKV